MQTNSGRANSILDVIPDKLVDPLIVVQRSLHAKSVALFQHSLLTALIAHYVVEESRVNFGWSPPQAFVAGVTHDVGKLYVSDAILGKCASMSQREWDIMKHHPIWGAEYVAGTVFDSYGEVILRHHETPDGSGYPNTSGDIALNIRLISFSDQTAAFLDDRPYRRSTRHFGSVCREVRQSADRLFPQNIKLPVIKAALEFAAKWIGGHKDPIARNAKLSCFTRGSCIQPAEAAINYGCGLGLCANGIGHIDRSVLCSSAGERPFAASVEPQSVAA